MNLSCFITFAVATVLCYSPVHSIFFNTGGTNTVLTPALFNVSGEVRIATIALAEVCSVPADPAATVGFVPRCVFCPRAQAVGIINTCGGTAPVTAAEFTCIVTTCETAVSTVVAALSR